MPDYKLYRLDGAGQISGAAQVITADTDEDAVARVREALPRLGCELWQGGRLVARLKD